MYDALLGILSTIFSFVYAVLTQPLSSISPSAYDLAVRLINAMMGIGVSISFIAFYAGEIRGTVNVFESKNLTVLLRCILRLVVVNLLMTHVLDLILLPVMDFSQGVIALVFQTAGVYSSGDIANIFSSSGFSGMVDDVLGSVVSSIIPGIDVIPMVMGIFGLIFFIADVITAVGILLAVVGRIFKLYIYIAISPIPISLMAGGGVTSQYSVNYFKNLAAVFFEGVSMALALVLFSALINQQALLDSLSVFFKLLTGVFGDSINLVITTFYLGGLAAMIKGADTLTHRLLGFA